MRDFALKVLNAESTKLHLFYVGQAGYILKNSVGQLLGIDLYLTECVERMEGHMGFKRLLPKILSPIDLKFDGIIATHSHYDHFDLDAIPEMLSNKKTRLYASANCELEIKKMNILNKNIVYVKANERYSLGNYELEFVPCDHGDAAPDAVGVIVTVDGRKIFITGDTCLRLDRVGEYLRGGAIDVMIAPINGAFGNMDEMDCAELSRALTPRLTIPCHYGMFAAHGGNPGLFMKRMQELCPQNKYNLLALGEEIIIQ